MAFTDKLQQLRATSQTPNLIRQDSAGPTFAPTQQDITPLPTSGFERKINVLRSQSVVRPQQIQQTPEQIQAQQQQVQAQNQQIIQQGIQQPEPRVVPAQDVSSEGRNILTRAITSIGNFLQLGKATDILDRSISEGYVGNVKREIISNATDQISLIKNLAESETDPTKKQRIDSRLAKFIQEINDTLGDDVFVPPTTTQQVGAGITAAATVLPVLRGGQLFRLAGESLVAKGVPLGIEGGAFFSGEAAMRGAEGKEIATQTALGVGIGAATPAALALAGKSISKIGGPIIRGLESPQQVKNQYMRKVARFIAPVGNVIKSIGETGAKIYKNLEDIRIERDFTVSRFSNRLTDFQSAYNVMTQPQRDSLWEILERNNRMNPAVKKQGRLFTVEELQNMTDDASIQHAISRAFATTREVSELQTASGIQAGRAFKTRKKVEKFAPEEADIILPSGTISVNELTETLAARGYKFKDIDSILKSMNKKIPPVINRTKTTDMLEYTNIPEVAIFLEKNLPKIISKDVVGKTGIKITTETLAKAPAQRLKVGIRETIIPTEAAPFVPHELLPEFKELIKESDELFNVRIREIVATNPRIAAIKDEALKIAAAREIAEREIQRGFGPGAGKLREKFYTSAAEARADGIDTDIVNALHGYIEREATAVAQLKVLSHDLSMEDIAKFLKKDITELTSDDIARAVSEKQMESLLDEMISKGISEKEARKVQKLVKDNIRFFLYGGDFDNLIKFARQFNALKLSLATINNLTQSIANLLKADMPAVYAGIKAAFGGFNKDIQRLVGVKGQKELAELAGVRTAGVIEDILERQERNLFDKFVNVYLKPFKWTELSVNRTFSANIGANQAVYLQRAINETAEGAKRIKMLNDLEDLIGKKVNVLKDKIQLDGNDVLRAANRFVKSTQFGINPLEQPWWANTAGGSLAWQFKTFIYHQTRLVFNSTIGELRAGNPGRAARNFGILATIYPMSGTVVGAIRNFISGQEREYDIWTIEGYLNSIAQVGGLGLLQDMLENAARTPQGLAIFFAGPTASTISGTAFYFIKSINKLSDGEIPLEEAENIAAQIFGGAARIPGAIIE